MLLHAVQELGLPGEPSWRSVAGVPSDNLALETSSSCTAH